MGELSDSLADGRVLPRIWVGTSGLNDELGLERVGSSLTPGGGMIAKLDSGPIGKGLVGLGTSVIDGKESLLTTDDTSGTDSEP